MVKEISINGCVFDNSGKMTEQEFSDKFIEFIESNGWGFGGGIYNYYGDQIHNESGI